MRPSSVTVTFKFSFSTSQIATIGTSLDVSVCRSDGGGAAISPSKMTFQNFLFALGHCDQVVSVLAFYCDDPSSNNLQIYYTLQQKICNTDSYV